MKLRPGTTVFPLDNELVLFSKEGQLIVGLNRSAAFVFRELERGVPAPSVAKLVAAAGLADPGESETWVASTLEALRSHGMLADGPASVSLAKAEGSERGSEDALADVRPYAPFTPVAEQYYRLLETVLLIRFGHLAQIRLVDAVIGHLRTGSDSAPNTVIEIAALETDEGRHLRSDVYREGEPVRCAPWLSQLAPIVKSLFWQEAVNAHDFLFYIHAGVVGTGSGCVLLPARAGSGKSSLTAALVHRGFRYYSDEVALIERSTFRVPPVPLAICVKSTGWDLMARYYPDIVELPIHRRGDGKVVRYAPPPPGAALHPPAEVTHIVFPRHRRNSATEIKTMARSDALGRLMGECLAVKRQLDPEIVQQLVRWISGIDCYSLEFSSLDEAVGLIADIVSPQEIVSLS